MNSIQESLFKDRCISTALRLSKHYTCLQNQEYRYINWREQYKYPNLPDFQNILIWLADNHLSSEKL